MTGADSTEWDAGANTRADRPPTPLLAAGTLVADRYRIVRPLGRGGMGHVHVARDERLGRDVAIKFLDVARFSGDPQAETLRRRFHDEARYVAALEHPGIVAIYDFGELDDVPFMVLQLLEGSTLAQQCSDGPPPALDVGVRVMRQLADGLAYAHRAGILHRDLKPDNIIVASDGTAKILDFGLAKLLPTDQSGTAALIARAETATGLMVGTPRYLAPELLRGDDASRASDLFSAGVAFFTYLTGRYPFEGEADPMYAIAFMEPPLASGLRADLPRTIDAVLLRMMAKHPRNRYDCFEDVIHDLDCVARGLAAPESVDDESLIAWRSLPSRTELELPFAGREQELAELEAALARAAAGELTFRIVSGDAGLGKSRLVNELRRCATTRQVPSYIGRAVATDGNFPYQPFISLFRTWAERHAVTSADRLHRLIEERYPALSGVAPILGSYLALGGERPRDREQLWHAFAALVEVLAGDRGALLILEDMHDADGASLDLLRYLLLELRRARLCVVATYRTGDESERLTRFLSEISSEGFAHQSELRPLTDAAVTGLVSRLIIAGGEGREVAELLTAEAAGNPLFLAERLKLWKADGVLIERGPGFALTREPSTASQPLGVRNVIERRIGRLDRDARDLAELAAVHGDPFSVEHLVATAGGDRLTLLRRLQALDRDSHLLVQQGEGRYRFAHATIRDYLYSEITPTIRAEYHGLIAEQLAKGANEELAPLLARHFEAAGRVEQAAHWFRRAGDFARQSFALEIAVEHYDRSLALAPEAEPLASHLGRAEALATLGELVEAEASYGAARDRAVAADEREQEAAARLGLAKVAEQKGAAALAIEEASKGLGLIEADAAHELTSQLLGIRGIAYILAGDEARSATDLSRAVEMARAGGARFELALAIYRSARSLIRTGALDAALPLLAELEVVAREDGNPTYIVRSLMATADCERRAGHLREAEGAARAAVTAAADGAGPLLLAIARLGLAAVLGPLGELESARELAEEVATFARRSGARRLLFAAIVNLLNTAQETSHLREALRLEAEGHSLRELVEPATRSVFDTERGALYSELGQRERAERTLAAVIAEAGPYAPSAEAYLGRHHLATDPARAAGHLESALGGLADTDPIERARAQAALARAYAASDRLGDATGTLGKVSGDTLELSLTVVFDVTLAAGVVASAAGDLDAAALEVERAVDVARGSSWRLRLADSLMILSRLEAARGDGPAASSLGDEARSLVDEVADELIDEDAEKLRAVRAW